MTGGILAGDETERDDRGRIRVLPSRLAILCTAGAILIALLVFAITVTIGTTTGLFCHCGDDSESCEGLIAKDAFNGAVRALSGTTETMACWAGSDADAPIMWVVSEDPLGNGIPWPVETMGNVCYASNVIPAGSWSQSSEDSSGSNGHF